jgi:hypothetical protein
MRVVPRGALGQDQRERAAHVRTLAARLLGSSQHFKEIANRDCATLALARPNE